MESEYQNVYDGSRDVIENGVWVDCLWPLEKLGLKKSGAMGSLAKKGYISTDGEVVAITETGYNALKGENDG